MREGRGSRLHVGWPVAALVAAPAGAVAATSIVKIAGSSGKIAQVDPANRLQVADSSPRSFVDTGYLEVDAAGGCRTLFDIPTNKALIVTQVSVVTKTMPSFDASHVLVMAEQPACAGAFAFVDQPHQLGTELFTLEPGLPVPAGATISARSLGNGTTMEVELRGYFVAQGAVT